MSFPLLDFAMADNNRPVSGGNARVRFDCLASWPKSTYDFGVNAWCCEAAPDREDATGISASGYPRGPASTKTGTAAFEVYDGGFNWASEVVYADLVFLTDERVICVTRCVGFDFGIYGSARIDDINPTAFLFVQQTLLRMYPAFSRVSPSFDDELARISERASRALACLDTLLPRAAAAVVARFLVPERPSDSMSPMLRSIAESLGVADVWPSSSQEPSASPSDPLDEAAALRGLYSILGAPRLPRTTRPADQHRRDDEAPGERENTHDMFFRVRTELDAIKLAGMSSGRDYALCVRFARVPTCA